MNTCPSSHAATGRRISHGCQVLTCYVKLWKPRRFSIQEWLGQSKWLDWKKPANGYPKGSSSTHFQWLVSLYKCRMWSYLVCSCWIVVVIHGDCVSSKTLSTDLKPFMRLRNLLFGQNIHMAAILHHYGVVHCVLHAYTNIHI
jgi:hypothetical protein